MTLVASIREREFATTKGHYGHVTPQVNSKKLLSRVLFEFYCNNNLNHVKYMDYI